MNYYEKIKFLVMDVDGTLTDGKVYLSDTGEAVKAFDIKDGCGIKEILPKYGIIPVIITARSSKILESRCKELDIRELHQGCRNKINKLEQIISDYSVKDNCNYSFENVAYIGDDIIDIQCMKPVSEAGGLTVCPQNAARAVIDIADYICINRCGEGAVREFIEWLVAMRTGTTAGLEKVKTISQAAYNFIMNFCPSKISDGKYELEDGAFVNVMTYVTKPVEITYYETHKKYIDIQYMIYGTELMVIQNVVELKNCVLFDYNEEKDVTLYNYNSGDAAILYPGDAIVLHPNDAHRGAIALNQPIKIRKIVVKIPINSGRE